MGFALPSPVYGEGGPEGLGWGNQNHHDRGRGGMGFALPSPVYGEGGPEGLGWGIRGGPKS